MEKVKNKCMMGLMLALMCWQGTWAQEIELPDSPPSDSYDLAEHYGMGGLDLWRTEEGLEGAIFNINTVSERGNVCDLSGVIRNGQARLPTANQGMCVVNFSHSPERIKVNVTTPPACESFCGLAAYFEGDYLKMPEQCSHEAKEQTEQLFNRQYRAKQYTQAVDTLRRMWQVCEPSMHWLEEMTLRNNLAISYAKMGDKDQCRKILQPYQKEIVSQHPLEEREPAVSYLFEDDYKIQIKNARYNWKLCQ